jgi:hypothetical protein
VRLEGRQLDEPILIRVHLCASVFRISCLLYPGTEDRRGPGADGVAIWHDLHHFACAGTVRMAGAVAIE